MTRVTLEDLRGFVHALYPGRRIGKKFTLGVVNADIYSPSKWELFVDMCVGKKFFTYRIEFYERDFAPGRPQQWLDWVKILINRAMIILEATFGKKRK